MRICYIFVIVFLATKTIIANKIRVMTFNTWNSGVHVEDGLNKIAKHIMLVNPDVVALQEVQKQDVLPTLLSYLGIPWKGITGDVAYPDVAILTKHEVQRICGDLRHLVSCVL
ncbi:unnamed protein product [Strongylus vulgaris]|uniref:Endonuclease/exonuclease/phosphatase domain-containing protein n=1 Tax=Strongylus vulgaris TaxID=40348 RepID=A0A3P7IKP0_STRVU|nr:unnamed protein product [Strongylus vulgaris]